MPGLNFCANLTWLFTELPMIDRFGAAKKAGFDAVEILFPHDEPISATRAAIDRAGLTLALINCPPLRETEEERGFAAVPGSENMFRRDFIRTLEVAQALGAHQIHIMSGAATGDEAKACFVENLRWAAHHASGQNLTIEPINPYDMPGYFLNDFDLGLDILKQVAAKNLKLQFDAYHAHRITGDVLGTWSKCRMKTSHVQVAGYPGRHEPFDCEIDYPAFFAQLFSDGYSGWVSGEYRPKNTTEAGLSWISE